MKNLPPNLFPFGLCLFQLSSGTTLDLKEVERVRIWIRCNWSKRKNMNTRHTSYSLKHHCEQALGYYVANGTLIGAMILEGFRYVVDYPGSPNCHFNVSLHRSRNKFRPPMKSQCSEIVKTSIRLSNDTRVKNYLRARTKDLNFIRKFLTKEISDSDKVEFVMCILELRSVEECALLSRGEHRERITRWLNLTSQRIHEKD